MMRNVMESSGLALWPVLSLVLFAAFTLALVLWLYRRGSALHYREMSGLALGGNGTDAESSGKDGR